MPIDFSDYIHIDEYRLLLFKHSLTKQKLSSLQEAARAVVDNVEHVGGYKVRKDLFNNLKKILEEQNDYK
jgi:hypothetical protein